MACWYSLNLGDAMLAGEALEQIKASFTSEHGSGPIRTGLYIRHESEGRLHCDVMVYFPPATATLAKRLQALPCAVPDEKSLGLLIGSGEA